MPSTPFHPDLLPFGPWLPHSVPLLPWLGPLQGLVPDAARRWFTPPGVQVRQLSEGVSVRIYGAAPNAQKPVLLWIHGGGFVMGAAQQDDALCARFAHDLHAVVVSVDYRLSPAHPFPTPLDDCFAAYEFLHTEAASLGADPSRLVLGGQSAGGGLAAGLTLLLHDRQRPLPRLQLLVYPMLDDRTALREVDGRDLRLWSQSTNRYGWASYLGVAPGAPGVSPHAAPARRDDLRGLPPAWIGVGTNDLFCEEDTAYAARLRAAGVPVELEVIPGVFHGFNVVFPAAPVSQAFYAAQVAAARRALAA